MLQRLPAAEMLMHFLDLHSFDDQAVGTELAELVLHQSLEPGIQI